MGCCNMTCHVVSRQCGHRMRIFSGSFTETFCPHWLVLHGTSQLVKLPIGVRKTSWAIRTGLKMVKLPIGLGSLAILSPMQPGLWTQDSSFVTQNSDSREMTWTQTVW